ncbi:40S ribosomal protein S6 [Striga asiatica]|uniref:40S ribosomal protein S6 n=1 Tax=Striga asiatica TaxID=4170 RepID=A0A5A7PJQ8_STRAF|nr:40S ribosomal protein S6 [Striga asiatica]
MEMLRDFFKIMGGCDKQDFPIKHGQQRTWCCAYAGTPSSSTAVKSEAKSGEERQGDGIGHGQAQRACEPVHSSSHRTQWRGLGSCDYGSLGFELAFPPSCVHERAPHAALARWAMGTTKSLAENCAERWWLPDDRGTTP